MIGLVVNSTAGAWMSLVGGVGWGYLYSLSKTISLIFIHIALLIWLKLAWCALRCLVINRSTHLARTLQLSMYITISFNELYYTILFNSCQKRLARLAVGLLSQLPDSSRNKHLNIPSITAIDMMVNLHYTCIFILQCYFRHITCHGSILNLHKVLIDSCNYDEDDLLCTRWVTGFCCYGLFYLRKYMYSGL